MAYQWTSYCGHVLPQVCVSRDVVWQQVYTTQYQLSGNTLNLFPGVVDETPAVSTKAVRDFCWFLKSDVRKVSQFGHNCYIQNHFQFIRQSSDTI